jgi:hypothetical protein
MAPADLMHGAGGAAEEPLIPVEVLVRNASYQSTRRYPADLRPSSAGRDAVVIAPLKHAPTVPWHIYCIATQRGQRWPQRIET